MLCRTIARRDVEHGAGTFDTSLLACTVHKHGQFCFAEWTCGRERVQYRAWLGVVCVETRGVRDSGVFRERRRSEAGRLWRSGNGLRIAVLIGFAAVVARRRTGAGQAGRAETGESAVGWLGWDGMHIRLVSKGEKDGRPLRGASSVGGSEALEFSDGLS